MASVTLGDTTTDTGNTPNTGNAWTPAIGDLIVVFVTKEASTAMVSADLTSNLGGFTYTLVRTELFRSSLDIFGVFVADQLCSAITSQTATIGSGSDAGAGSIISVYRISGMSRAGASAIRQQGGQSNQSASTTPAPAFAGAALSANTCIGAVANSTNTAGLTPPSNWSESQDVGYTTGAVTGLETAFRNSGETGTTITWGSTSASAFASIIIELDTSVPLFPFDSLRGQAHRSILPL